MSNSDWDTPRITLRDHQPGRDTTSGRTFGNVFFVADELESGYAGKRTTEPVEQDVHAPQRPRITGSRTRVS